MFKNIDEMVVGEIVDDKTEEKSETDDKHHTVRTNSTKCGSKTHLILGSEYCGKTDKFKKIIQEKIRRYEDVLYLVLEYMEDCTLMIKVTTCSTSIFPKMCVVFLTRSIQKVWQSISLTFVIL